jgi:hypothetical protein
VRTFQPPLPLAGEGALAGKSTLSLTLSHQWERGHTQVCSVLPRKRSEVIDFYGFKNAGIPLSHWWEREPRRGGRGCSYREKHPLPNPSHQWEGTNSGLSFVCKGCFCSPIPRLHALLVGHQIGLALGVAFDWALYRAT